MKKSSFSISDHPFGRAVSCDDTTRPIPITKLLTALAAETVRTMDPYKIQTARVLLYEPGKAPLLALAKRNEFGLYVKPDGSGGMTYTDEMMRGRLYPMSAFEVLMARWFVAVCQSEHAPLKVDPSADGALAR